MGIDKRIVDSAGNEAKVDATDEALQVKATLASVADLDDIETTLTNLEKALQSINTDYLKVQARDAAGNLMPSMDAVARPGFQKITDGVDVLSVIPHYTAFTAADRGIINLAYRAQTSLWIRTPVAIATDTDANKGESIIPVTPMTREREEGVRTHTNDSCFVVSYEANAVEAKTGYVLIDLSNATNYPHTEVNEIHVDWLAFSMLGDVSCEGHVHIGFISAIDADKGTLISFVCKPADKIARASFVSRQYNPSAVRCKTAAVLAGGGMKIVDDTTFQNDVVLAGTYEAVIPAVGDLVMLIDRVAGSFDTVSVAIGYHTI